MDQDDSGKDRLDASHHKRITELFLTAREMDAGGRTAFLDQACAGDSALRAQVESLLAHDSTEVLDTPSTQRRRVRSPTRPSHPARIGPYRILEVIGEGGMGIVYVAEQEKPVRRKVAVKVIKRGMDTKQVVARFEAERQALAMMNHPNVAKVFDAGATEQGRPYFAMELVKGEPITKHCDRQRLTTHERLELFMQVCEGVQHAHQKGIIHRDIKPSNILVQTEDDKRIPKIIDFGVAKATQQRLTERTLFTEQGVMIGTPEYMSPEQAEMTAEDIDTRTDVYSLGVLLYELLVGALPFDPRELRQAGFDEIRRKIREDEPSKPSTRLSTLGDASSASAKRRRTDLRTLKRQLSGDLDWITMRALEKDRVQRYGSPSDLAEDIRRHLRHEPVIAGPPSTLYRVRKFVRRHKFGVGAAAAAVLLVVLFGVTMALQAGRIAVERDRANRERETSEKVSVFLADMLGDMDPQVMGLALWKDQRERVAEVRRGGGATEDEIEAVLAALEDALSGVNATDVALQLVDEQILSRARETIAQELAEEPRIAGRLEHTIGVTYRKLGLWEQAERHAKRAVDIRERELGRDHPDTLHSMNNLATVYKDRGLYDKAESLYLETLEVQKRVLGNDHPHTLDSMNNLAIVYHKTGRYDEAEALHLEAIETRKHVLGENHPDTLSSMGNLAVVYWSQGRAGESERLQLETLKARRRRLGDDHPDTLTSMGNLSVVYSKLGRYKEAESLYLETIRAEKRVLGDNHPNTLRSINNLIVVYHNQGRYDEAERLLLEILGIQRRILGNDHPDTLNAIYNLAKGYGAQGRNDEAEPLYLETLETRRRVLGDDHPDTLLAMNAVAGLYANQGRYDDAEPLFLEALKIQKRVLGEDHRNTLVFMGNVATLYRDQGRYDEAESLFVETLEAQERVLGDDHPYTATSMHNLACLRRDMGKHEEARTLFERAQGAWENKLGVDHPLVAENLEQWAALLRKTGDDAGADRMEARAKAIRKKLAGN